METHLQEGSARVMLLQQELGAAQERHAAEAGRLRVRIKELEMALQKARRQVAAVQLSSKGLTLDQALDILQGDEVGGTSGATGRVCGWPKAPWPGPNRRPWQVAAPPAASKHLMRLPPVPRPPLPRPRRAPWPRCWWRATRSWLQPRGSWQQRGRM